MRISDWSSDVCSSDLLCGGGKAGAVRGRRSCRQGGAAAPDHAVRNRPRRSRNEGNTAMTNASSAALDPKLLEILVCPLTRGQLIYDRERNELISKQAGLASSIRDGIPVMLPDRTSTRLTSSHYYA